MRHDHVAGLAAPAATGPCPPSPTTSTSGSSRHGERRQLDVAVRRPARRRSSRPSLSSSSARVRLRRPGDRHAGRRTGRHLPRRGGHAGRAALRHDDAVRRRTPPADRTTAPRLRGSVTPSSATISAACPARRRRRAGRPGARTRTAAPGGPGPGGPRRRSAGRAQPRGASSSGQPALPAAIFSASRTRSSVSIRLATYTVVTGMPARSASTTRVAPGHHLARRLARSGWPSASRPATCQRPTREPRRPPSPGPRRAARLPALASRRRASRAPPPWASAPCPRRPCGR